MDTIPHRQRLTLPIAPLAAGVLAALIALFFALLPADVLGRLALDSGIAALVPAAEPPLGFTARAALILVGGGGVGLIAWFALFLAIGNRSMSISRQKADKDAVPVLRRADAHPDAPARRPLSANRDLGMPFLDVRAPLHIVADETQGAAAQGQVIDNAPLVERDLPADLDQPMSAYDPQAMTDEPVVRFPSPVELKSQRPQVFDEHERFETFELTPMVRPSPQAASHAAAAPRRDFDPSASIHALLDRLEKGVAGNADAPLEKLPPPRHEGLQESLATLRRLATNG